jgi:Fic family protein
MGAYRFLGKPDKAQRIKNDLLPSVARISPVNPFKTKQPLLLKVQRVRSPQVARLNALWVKMRPDVLSAVEKHFPAADHPVDTAAYLAGMEDIYQHDAYNSLSIEGYRVTPAIIERVRTGDWNPERVEDREHVAAMAAKGYFDAFKLVKQAVQAVLQGKNSAKVTQAGVQDWYRALFGASVQAGILEPADLAGYRNRPVYIRGSVHVPPPQDALMDCMETYFDLLEKEDSAAVRAVLGHFMFVFIHPYPDGNGRLGRFLMNLMLASGGYPWTVIRLNQQEDYMNALGQASANQNIHSFTKFIAQEIKVDWTQEKKDLHH